MAATASPDPVAISLERAKEILGETYADKHDLDFGDLLAERRAAANTIVSLSHANEMLEERCNDLERQLDSILEQARREGFRIVDENHEAVEP